MWTYSPAVTDHFLNPRNAGALADANAVGEAGSLDAGDALRLTLRVNPETRVIEAAGFQAFGCGPAIAVSSVLTELVIGKTVDQAARLTGGDIAARLDGLPPEKAHAPALGKAALAAALRGWCGGAGPAAAPGAGVCGGCAGVDLARAEGLIRADRLTTLPGLLRALGAGDSCSLCRQSLQSLLARVNAAMLAEGLLAPDEACPPPAPPRVLDLSRQPPAMRARRTGGPPMQISAPAAALRPAVRRGALAEMQIAERVIAEMRPTFRADGGDVQLVDIDGIRVMVTLTGTCAGCQVASLTLGGLGLKLSAALGRTVRCVPVMKS